MTSPLAAAGIPAPGVSGQAVAASGVLPSPRQSTPGRLRRQLIVVLVTAVLLWVTATILLGGLDGTAVSVRGAASPAFLNAIEARATVSGAARGARTPGRRCQSATPDRQRTARELPGPGRAGGCR